VTSSDNITVNVERDRRRQQRDRQADKESGTLFNPEVLNEINQPTARVLLQI